MLLLQKQQEIKAKLASDDFRDFVQYTKPDYEINWHHDLLMDYLQQFAEGKIKKLMVFMPPQHGKLLPIDTPILTTKGWVNHGDLIPGDFVYGQDGKPKKVIANSGSYKWKVVNMTFQDGKTIKCANEHLWNIKVEYDDRKGRRELICETKDIFNKKHRRLPYIDVSPCLDTEKKELEIEPYILGCWLGDGHSRQGVLTVGQEDIEHFSKLGEAREVKKGIYRVLIDGLTTKLRANNLYKNKHIPIDYLLSSKEQRLELLRGLMDTDGCVDKEGNCEFSQKDNQLVKDVYVLIRSLGIKCRIKYYDAFINGKLVGKKCRIGFNPNKGEHIFNLQRKQDRLNNKIRGDRNDKYKLFIKSIIDENEYVQGNCIQVEGSMYLAGYDLIPTHNSELTSRRLPAYLLGRNPKLKIIGCSYSSDLATSFNRDVQRIIDDQKYSEIFPDTTLNGAGAKAKGNYLRNSDMFEIVEHRGFYKSIGVGGSLTGTPADIGIIDDPVKDAIEAESITYRSRVWDWFTQVFLTRLHNDSQIIVTQTRWNLDDLSGRILSRMNHDNSWTILSLPAINEGVTSIHDVREPGEALWESKHSLKRLMEIKVANPRAFQALYQQDPKPFEGGLVFSKWNSISLEDFNQVKGLDGYGMDFGYNDPTVLLHVKIDKANKKLYINEKLYKSNLTSETIRNEMIRLDISKNTRIIADNARPEIIAELRKVFNMKPSTKGANSIYYGILKILEFELYITRNSHNVIREIGSYRYKEDKDGNFSNEVVEIDDHSMDALRYIVRDLVDGDKGVLAFG